MFDRIVEKWDKLELYLAGAIIVGSIMGLLALQGTLQPRI